MIFAGTNPSCSSQPKIGTGCTSALAYYFDTSSKQCHSFLYSGCDKTSYFTTHATCLSTCGKDNHLLSFSAYAKKQNKSFIYNVLCTY